MNKKVIIAISVTLGAVVLIGLVGAGLALARYCGFRHHMDKRWAYRCGRNANRKEAFDEGRDEGRNKQEAHFSERLDEAVKEGKITAEQKKAILDKKAELQKERKKQQEEMKKWAKENNIDLKVLWELMPGRRGPRCSRGMGGGPGD